MSVRPLHRAQGVVQRPGQLGCGPAKDVDHLRLGGEPFAQDLQVLPAEVGWNGGAQLGRPPHPAVGCRHVQECVIPAEHQVEAPGLLTLRIPASAGCTPRSAMLRPIAAAILPTSSGSKGAPQASEEG